MKKETMYNLGRILLLVAAVLLIFSIVLYAVSAVMINKLEAGLAYYGTGMNLNAKTLKVIINMAKSTMSRYYDSAELSIGDILEYSLDVDVPAGVGFAIFAMYARGWFMLVTVLVLIASLVLMMIAKEPALISMGGQYCVAVGHAFVKAFKDIFSGISMPKPAPRAPKARYNCPNCGAPINGQAPFCAQCGMKLPDLNTIGVCQACGTRNDPNANFCAGCGAPLK